MLTIEELESIANEGFIYGFAPVVMEETRQRTIGPKRPCRSLPTIAGFDQAFEPANPAYRTVVKPNVDTLYSAAFIDLSDGPIALDMPAVDDRYVLMAMYDAYTNNFAGPGTETHGSAAARYTLVGPGQSADCEGFLIEAPTNVVWIIGRTEFFGKADLPNANAIQKQYSLTALNGELPSKSQECLSSPPPLSPNQLLMRMSAIDFFAVLHEVMVRNPPPERDHEIETKLAKIGVGPNASISLSDLSEEQAEALNRGVDSSRHRLMSLLGKEAPTLPWSPVDEYAVGIYGAEYEMRTIVAIVGLAANIPEYSVYKSSALDAYKQTYDGRKTYELTFPPGTEPPVRAFWSLTVYDNEGFLVPNEINRYSVGSNTGLVRETDGTLRIILASQLPDDTPPSNWLPTPDQRFTLTLRLYAPEEVALAPSWVPPNVKPIEY